ncbi:hypothetical protein [Jeongeupia sp. USM3]|uniref:hypothetical protein n=1 Tax=Jeongeupia sp. USM3 TaxID=1906741 RepID=UPI0011AB4AB4|nr:hypothetical protein [Jeongeupia sp. USM3]
MFVRLAGMHRVCARQDVPLGIGGSEAAKKTPAMIVGEKDRSAAWQGGIRFQHSAAVQQLKRPVCFQMYACRLSGTGGESTGESGRRTGHPAIGAKIPDDIPAPPKRC